MKSTKENEMKTNELTGATLDWAVAKCEGYRLDLVPEGEYTPSTDWSQGGPIIEREGVGLDQYADYPQWQAFTPAPEQPSGQAVCNGPTPLIAAMRCYVASKMGAEIDLPKELT
jgi:hypothetical protein